MTGITISNILVLSQSTTRNTHKTWNCMCHCGKLFVAVGAELRRGMTKSCGCTRQKAHGKYESKEYRVWLDMKQRCNNPRNKSYRNYGERGISVSLDWLDFKVFYKDMGDCPKGLTLDRIDNNGGYSKTNCQWSTLSEQSRNRRPKAEWSR